MIPADQGFYSGRVVIKQAYLGLVQQGELVALDGFFQFFFQSQPLQDGVVQIFREELVVVASGFFGRIHGQVGVFHQGIDVVGVARRHGDAYAH